MSSAAEHFDKILEELTLQCLFGQVHYRIWRQMNNKFKEEPRFAETAIFFFRRTAEAHLNSATLYLNHLIDKDRRATSIYYLINYAQKHPDIFKHSSEEQVVEAIEKDREHLDQFDDLLKKIRQQRDKHFMHRAKEYLPHPYVHDKR